MNPLEVILAKRQHLARLANEGGAEGERLALAKMEGWLPRPKGDALKKLLVVLAKQGLGIKGSSFDAIEGASGVDFRDSAQIEAALPSFTFIEIKTANQARVKPGFAGYFFALTEAEIAASDLLRERHRVALFNKQTGELMLTSIPEILNRAKSMNWQVSVQL